MDWLDPLDAAMMTAEALSRPLNIGAVLILSPPKGAGPHHVDELHRAAVSGRDPVDPRLRRYPHRGAQTVGGWVWREADTVDLSQHCRRMRLTSGGGRNDLWRAIGRLHAEPLDRSRPMWMSYLIDGLAEGRFAFYVKIHHTVMDGVAGFQMISDALSPDPKRRSMPHFYAAQHREQEVRTARHTLELPNPLPMLRSVAGTAVSAVALAGRIVTGEVSDLVASLTGDTTVPLLAAPHTRFNGRLGHERTVAADTWPRTRIRALQDKAGVTGNDAVTAVVAGALRRWLLDHEELPTQSLVAICPITVRSRGHATEERHNNMFGAWLCPLGTHLPDPLERLDLIHRSMSEGKHRVASRGPGASLLLLAAAIGPTVLLPMLPFSPKLRTGYNLPISHVPGPQAEMYWNGAHVEEIYPVSAVYDGQALNVTTCSYADRIGFGYVAGRDVVPDIDTLIPLTEQSLTELESALGLLT
ncbi:wax ester/triacylglycerol synthase family O-acyltransferase [Mycolicibacterium stellerae]|uniref:wax ester/triacylglycerol synthase family O-acyltransferase n=1 Tax=Mycolicibacterium stellerae TaxID=2358193 RepID=UPI000F0B6A85|nr:wax ester/triacylglycerol synthase family O-acyltransferase [Mycolicibacterium stellerae]